MKHLSIFCVLVFTVFSCQKEPIQNPENLAIQSESNLRVLDINLPIADKPNDLKPTSEEFFKMIISYEDYLEKVNSRITNNDLIANIGIIGKGYTYSAASNLILATNGALNVEHPIEGCVIVSYENIVMHPNYTNRYFVVFSKTINVPATYADYLVNLVLQPSCSCGGGAGIGSYVGASHVSVYAGSSELIVNTRPIYTFTKHHCI